MSDLKVSLQLFSVRNELEADMYGTLKAVKEMGYDYVQFAGFGKYNAYEVKEMLDELGLKCISAHVWPKEILENGQEFIDGLKHVGIRYIAYPYMGRDGHMGGENCEEYYETIRKTAEVLKENGIVFLYHNHEFELSFYEGKRLIDWLYESIPADLLKTEFDTCWVKFGGADPCEYLRKYNGRNPVVHLKDFVSTGFEPCYAVKTIIDENGNEVQKSTRELNNFCLKPLGLGMQDFPAIIKAAEETGAEEICVEQDEWPEHTALEAARLSREYLRSIGY